MSDKKRFLDQFDHLTVTLPLQADARAAIHNGLDFPTTRDEYWKYTRVNGILQKDFTLHEESIDSIDAYKIHNLDAHYVVFVNGIYRAELSDGDLPRGVEMTSIQSTEGERKQQMLTHLGVHIDSDKNAFNAFNTSYFQDGAFLTIAKDVIVEKPIVILHVSSGENNAANMRNLVLIGQHAKVDVVTLHRGLNNQGTFNNVVSEIVAEEGAKGGLYIIEDEGVQTTHINSTQVVQERNSTFQVLTVTRSGQLVRNNLNFSIKDEGCESNMFGVYFTDDNQHVDNHTYADHQKPHCNSNELYKGVMGGKSTGVFNGKIMVHQDAQQTNAFQSNQNILLSDRATINTKPELEIYADDVKCSHGCTIGQLDEEAMFYLRSRGLGQEAATMLLIQAFAGDVLENVEIEALRLDLEDFIHQKFEKIDA